MGLLRSADGGLTWQHVPSAVLVGRAIFDLAIDPSNPLHLLVATTTGLFESRDGGATCTLRISGACWDVSIHPLKSNQVLAATETGLQRSSDGGTTWHSVPLAGVNANTRYARMAVCHAPSKPDVVYVAAADTNSVAHLWRRGSAQSAFVAEAVSAAFAGPQPVAGVVRLVSRRCSGQFESILFWGAIDLYRGTRSASGKWQWLDISSRPTGSSIHPDQHHVAFDPRQIESRLCVLRRRPVRSPDLGDSWVSLNRGLAITRFEFLARSSKPIPRGSSAHGPGGLARSVTPAYGSGIRSRSATAAHAERTESNDAAITRTTASALNAPWYPIRRSPGKTFRRRLRTTTTRCSIRRWPSTARAWRAPESPCSCRPIPARTGRRSRCRRGTTARPISVRHSCSRRRNALAATVGGRVFRISAATATGGGAAVTALAAPSAGFISDIVLNGASLWVSVSSFGAGHVFRSSDMGELVDRSGNLRISINALVIDPQDAQRVFAATGRRLDRQRRKIMGILQQRPAERRRRRPGHARIATPAARWHAQPRGLGSRCVTEGGAARNQVRCA